MLKRALLLVLVMLTLPNLASAYNVWSITRSASPATLAASIQNPADLAIPGYYTTPGAPTTYVTAASSSVANVALAKQSADFTVTAPTGYLLAYVTIDGVKTAPFDALTGTYRVLKGTKTSHTITAVYGTQNFTITTSKTGNGYVTSSATVPAGSNKSFDVVPGSGARIKSIVAAGAVRTNTGTSATVAFTDIRAAKSVVVEFEPVPAVDAKLTNSAQTVAAGTSLVISGATSTSSVPATYTWSVSPAGPTFTPSADGKTATFNATAAGTYRVNLALSATDATTDNAFVDITVSSAATVASNVCITCHVDRNEANVTAYQASTHASTETASCLACHSTKDANGVVTQTMIVNPGATACANCHSTTVTKFNASIHWLSETGHESDADFVASGHGSVASCAAKCHFNQGATKGCAVCHSGALQTGGVIAATEGAHAINANATVTNTCLVCHSGSKHGWSPRAYDKSSHSTTTHSAEFAAKKCLVCHNSHSTEATFGDGTVAAGGCASCHAPGAYGILNADGSGKAPHGGGLASTGSYVDGTQRTQYLSQGAICSDCHGHNNTTNAGFAEGGHGKVSDDALNAFAHYDWSGRTNNGTRQNGNCDRCHTSGGFVKFLGNDTATANRLAPQPGIQNVLTCVGCHKAIEGEGMENAPLRTDATPAGNPTALTGGYFALFSSASATAAGTQGQVAANKTKIEISFPGYKNSSICVPCHAGRSTAAVFVAVIDQAKAVNKNYSTVTTSYYQHAANMGQTFISQGGYDFGTTLAGIQANGPSAHAAIKMGATDTQGPCVACHYSKDGAGHSLEVVAGPSCIAAACHATTPNVEEAKASFDAGVAALDTLIRSKFDTLRTVETTPLETERGNIRFGRFGKAAGVAADDLTAKRAYGAWYNWQILATYDKAAYAHNPRYARQILNDTIAFLQVGTGAVPSGSTSRNAVTAAITANSATPEAAALALGFITAPGCAACHADKVSDFTTAGAYHFTERKYSCANCHTEQHIVGTPTCSCHGDNATTHPVLDAMNALTANCNKCHTSNDIHTMKAAAGSSCVACHDVKIAAHDGKVNDNNGVRAITGASGEFGLNTAKKSHHIVNSDGSDPTDAQCLACHAEGTVVAGAVVIDANFHMKDNKTYLRNGGGIPAEVLATELGGDKSTLVSGVSVFAWNPATPDHNLMDQFCFSCHNENGAPVAAAAIVAALPAATATNPFADTISNGYDQMARGKVVNAFGQFDTGNASHHAVRGARYSGKTRTAGADRLVTSPATFANTSSAVFNGVAYEAGKAGPGVRQTLFDAGFFSTSYSPLGSTGTKTTLGDDSTLHCGDCHTVGQWTNTNTTYNKAAIGAHGSVNEYMLRNSQGTDALHNAGRDNSTAWNDAADDMADINGKASLVCYNCHAFSRYGALGKHEGVNSGLDCNGDVWTNAAAGRIGSARLLREAPFTSNGEGSNMFGIQCANCHNSGPAAQFGGIHGGNITYTDGTGATQKPYRFLPGLGNVKYAPNNHLRNDGKTTFSGSPAETAAITAAKNTNTPELTNTWEEKTLFTGSRATCYTLNENPTGTMPAKGMKNPATDAYAPGQLVTGTWGACTDHGGSSIAGGHAGTGNVIRNPALRDVQRPLTY